MDLLLLSFEMNAQFPGDRRCWRISSYCLELRFGGRSPLYFLSHCCGGDALWTRIEPPAEGAATPQCSTHTMTGKPIPAPKPASATVMADAPTPNVRAVLCSFQPDDNQAGLALGVALQALRSIEPGQELFGLVTVRS